MTYDAFERSTHGASPVELYDFTRNATVWRYTSQGADYDLSGTTYRAVPIERSSAESSQTIERSELKIRMPRDVEVIESFVAIPPASVMTLTLRRVHRTDPDAEAVVVWMGRVLNVEWRQAEAELVCEPVFTSLRRSGLRRFFSRNCPHALYDSQCKANPAEHRYDGTVSAIDGSNITVPEAAAIEANVLKGGYVAWVSADGVGEQRTIVGQSGTTIKLIAPPIGLNVGDEVSLHEGCKHTLSYCESRFSNADNYGGFPDLPLRNPFDFTPSY